MSMGQLTLLQLGETAAAYLFMTMVIPSLLLYQKIKGHRLAVRFLMYQTMGNFVMINLVYLLELLRISNKWTLLLTTVGVYAFLYGKWYHKKPQNLLELFLKNMERISTGEFGTRLLLGRGLSFLREKIKAFFRHIMLGFSKNVLETVLTAALLAALAYWYGSNLLVNYGYGASDIPVHNYWINHLGKNQIFVAGVYPFGFHNVIYYLRTVFGIPTYVLLRVFCFVQTMVIHLVLLAFIRCCCKTRYAAYFALFVYVAVNFFHPNTYLRYLSSLPQEFGMMFLLPSIYFLFAFFETTKKNRADGVEENQLNGVEKEARAVENWYLVFFAMNFSMTLTVHFYGTMIAGLYCLGGAAAYCFRLFRKPYFGRVMTAGILSVVAAILPMAAAFLMGTPLQGSLGWGMNVMTGKYNVENSAENASGGTGSAEGLGMDEAGAAAGTEVLRESEVLGETEMPDGAAGETTAAAGKLFLKQSHAARGISGILSAMKTSLLAEETGEPCVWLIPAGIGLLLLLAAAFFVLRQTDYAARFLSTGIFMILMSILLGAKELGIPELMDANRSSIYYAYVAVILLGLCVDGGCVLLFGWWRKSWLLNLVSLAASFSLAVASAQFIGIKPLSGNSPLEMNENIICLTNIIRENKDMTWTICSANDELHMAEDYGYHYEISEFLNRMEYAGPYGKVTIPTKKVYFFIEKIPVDYCLPYEGSGQRVSEEGARRELPVGNGLFMYKGENRWIEMSRMYYWAKAFSEMYPNEMKVYYETDRFICYYVEQNEYSLYNFSIDYAYNMGGKEKADVQ